MSTFRNPVGPQPSGVYWRRRLIVALAIVAVIVVALLIFVRPGAGGADAGSPASPSASGEPTTSDPADEPTAEPSTEPADGAPCDPAAVRIEAITDTNSYAPGQLPQLSFKVTNTGGTSCTYDLGTTEQTFLITSGEEPYWNSRDCLVEPAPAAVLLEPNLAQNSTPIPWDRTRSTPDTCDTDRTAVPAGGATFNLTVTVGAAESSTISFLLN